MSGIRGNGEKSVSLSLDWGIREVITTRYDEVPQRVTDVPSSTGTPRKEALSPGDVGELHGGDI